MTRALTALSAILVDLNAKFVPVRWKEFWSALSTMIAPSNRLPSFGTMRFAHGASVIFHLAGNDGPSILSKIGSKSWWRRMPTGYGVTAMMDALIALPPSLTRRADLAPGFRAMMTALSSGRKKAFGTIYEIKMWPKFDEIIDAGIQFSVRIDGAGERVYDLVGKLSSKFGDQVRFFDFKNWSPLAFEEAIKSGMLVKSELFKDIARQLVDDKFDVTWIFSERSGSTQIRETFMELVRDGLRRQDVRDELVSIFTKNGVTRLVDDIDVADLAAGAKWDELTEALVAPGGKLKDFILRGEDI